MQQTHKIIIDSSNNVTYYSNELTNQCNTTVSDDTEQRKEVNEMLTKTERKSIERLADMMQSMDEMQKAQLCAFAEGLAMALEHSKRAS